MSMSAREMAYSAKMSGSPEFYSGRPAMCCDLDGQKLLRIHNLIKENIGESAAENFVKMIENISSLAATNFLNQLYALEAHGWVYFPTSESNIDFGPDTEGRLAVALGTLCSSLYPAGDSTDFIRNSFFRSIGHSVEPSASYDGYLYY